MKLEGGGGGVDIGLYGRWLQYLSERRLGRQGKQLHSRLILLSVTPDNYLASKLITLYAKTDNLSYARRVFYRIPFKNTFSFNAMLISYSLHNRHLDALRLFSSGLNPDNVSITCLFKSLSAFLSNYLLLGKGLHSFALTTGFAADLYVQNALITYYSKCHDFVSARKLFDTMPLRDVITWNSMISGYSHAGHYHDCKRLYTQMVASSGIRLNEVTVVSVLQACGHTMDLAFGMQVHHFVVQNKIKLDISLCNALIGFYAKCGSLDYARELFDEMSDKDEITYSSLISGLMNHGYVDQSLDLFRQMRTQQLSTWNAVISGLVQNNRHEWIFDLVREMQALGFRPNAVTLSSIFPTFSNLKDGKEVHSYAVKNGYDQNIYVATAIIDMYGKLGYLHGSRKVFDQSKGRSLVIWTAIISAYAVHGDTNSVLNLFHEMVNNGIQPDEVTFTTVLSACAHSGMVDEAQEIFNEMPEKYGIQRLVEHYACVVDALSRVGRLSEAREFVSQMPVEPSAKVWGSLLQGASVAGDVDFGKFVCDHLFETEPENTGNYVIMANLYSEAGRWEEADEVRKRMNEFGLKKVPGSSWIRK
ncbi:Pentatricopeptide repeat (PPR) superfamily protein [Euphorbia peplus]|nr:Pentatricopeptide repeat (PPR) superfamily protein [Euphorbia peplus]